MKNLPRTIQNRARTALEHQKSGKDVQDWLDWLHICPTERQCGANGGQDTPFRGRPSALAQKKLSEPDPPTRVDNVLFKDF